MALASVELADLVAARARLMADIAGRVDDQARGLLLALHEGEPDFGEIDRAVPADLPGIKWKLQNRLRLKQANPSKQAEQRNLLRNALGD